MATDEDLDFIIIGAGISGIGAACHLVRRCPTKRLAILEQREAMGGTWDVYRDPGIRCDSDMYSFGYAFRPWPTNDIITSGQSILDYVRGTAVEYGVDKQIRYGHHVQRASWDSETDRWTVHALVRDGDTQQQQTLRARFLLLCPGVFRYDEAFTPDIPGIERFSGRVIHPQFWPDDLDHAGKRVVVIGSGATAVTLVPSMAKTGADVTMLQRSPTYFVTVPWEDPSVRLARRFLPDAWVSRATLVRNTVAHFSFYTFCRRYPQQARRLLLAGVRRQLKGRTDATVDIDMKHFTPRYMPWDQRLCVVPSADLFKVLRQGRAKVVTDHIESVDEGGIRLQSGEYLDADVIVTATGFNLQLFGGIQIEVDGEHVEPGDRVLYNAAMIDGVPNFAMYFGYSNVSWTRKVDALSAYLCRLFNHMDRTGQDVVTPRGGEAFLSTQPFVEMTSGYLKRGVAQFPKQGSDGPWRTSNNVLLDTFKFRFAPLEDGHLELRRSRKNKKRGLRGEVARKSA